MKAKKYFVCSDPHVLMVGGKVGGIDILTNNAVVKFIEDEGPWDGYVNAGDHFDMNVVSDHNKGKLKLVEGQRLFDDYRAGNAVLQQHYTAAGSPGKFYLLEGNHEDRVRRYIDAKPELEGIVNVEKFLPDFVTYIKYWSKHEILKLGRLNIIHGVGTASGQCRKALADYGRNTLMGHCVSEDTEVLTQDGWKRHTELPENSEVGTLNLATNKIEFQRYSEKFVYGAEKYPQVVNFRNTHADILVTGDHGMVEILESGNGYNLPSAADLLGRSRVVIPLGGNLGSQGIGLTDDQIRLLVWIAADGSFDKLKTSYRLRWHFKKARKIEALSALLTRLSVDFKQYPMAAGTVKIDIQVPAWVPFYIAPWNKMLPEVFRLASKEQARVIFDTISITDGNRNGNTIQYSTFKESEADLVQEIAVLNNLRAAKTARPGGFIVSIHDIEGAQTTFSRGQIKFVDNTSDVWCLTVPNGTLVFRRNGKVFITQNSHRREVVAMRYHGDDETKIAESIPVLCEYRQPYLNNRPTAWSQGFVVLYLWPDGRFNHFVVSVFDHGFISPSGKYYNGRKMRPETRIVL